MDKNSDDQVFDDSLESFADELEEIGTEVVSDSNGKPKGSFALTRLQGLEKPALEEELVEPDGGSPCSCNAVCECVPVVSCGCFAVCQCDTVDSCTSNVTPCGCNGNVVWFVPCG